MVYSYIIPERCIFSLEALHPNTLNIDPWSDFGTLLPLRLVSSEINKQILDHFFRLNTFAIDIQGELKAYGRRGRCSVIQCAKNTIPILQNSPLRDFCMTLLFVNTNFNDAERDWIVYTDRVGYIGGDTYVEDRAADIAYEQQLEIKGQQLLEDLLREFRANDFNGFEARHLERIIDGMNNLIKRELQTAFVDAVAQTGLRRSVRLASNPNPRRY